MILPEWSITELQQKMESGELTARRIAELYLGRIEAVDKSGPYINSVIELNPDALTIAASLDEERKTGKLRVLPDDVKALVVAILGHRVIVSPAARLRELSADRIVQEIAYNAPVPGGDYQAVASTEKVKGKAK